MPNFPLGDITSANATLVLIVNGLFPAGVRLQQFSTDQSYSQDELTIAEDRMGVDGGLWLGALHQNRDHHAGSVQPQSCGALAALPRLRAQTGHL